MFDFKPIGYRVLAEKIGERKLPSGIELPDGTFLDAIPIWQVKAKGDDMILVTGEHVSIYQVEVGDIIIFDRRRAAIEVMPSMLCGGKLFALVDVEGIVCVVKGDAEPVKPAPKLFVPDKALAA